MNTVMQCSVSTTVDSNKLIERATHSIRNDVGIIVKIDGENYVLAVHSLEVTP